MRLEKLRRVSLTQQQSQFVCGRLFKGELATARISFTQCIESNGRNVARLSYKEDTTKVQQLETFPVQDIGASKFLLDKTPADGSSGIAKPSLVGNVQFKKRNVARLNATSFYSESQPVSFGASQQTVKIFLHKKKKVIL